MKVLFVVTSFFPEQAIGSIRVTKFAKYLHEQGVSVSVISLKPPPWTIQDETLWFEGLNQIKWDVIDQSPLFNRVFQRARVATVGTGAANAGSSAWSALPTWKRRIRASAQLGYTLLKAIDWSYRVRKHAQKHHSDKEFDFIFCSYPSFASPLSGRKLKKLGIGKYLAVDFRDPVVTVKPGRLSPLRWLQRRILLAADLRLYVSQGVRQQVVGDGPTIWDHVASNGFDPEDAPALMPADEQGSTDKVLRFVYTGAMYGGRRDLRPFFKAVSALLARSSHARELINIAYAGVEGNVFRSQAKEFGLEDRVSIHGRLRRLDALTLQQTADICLLATWNSSSEQGVLTGKVFEYILLKKPIVAIVGGDMASSEISKLISAIGAGHTFEAAVPDSMAKLERWLETALQEKQAAGKIRNRYNERVNEFNIREITIGIHQKLKTIVELNSRL